jgi:hypothetical protein
VCCSNILHEISICPFFFHIALQKWLKKYTILFWFRRGTSKVWLRLILFQYHVALSTDIPTEIELSWISLNCNVTSKNIIMHCPQKSVKNAPFSLNCFLHLLQPVYLYTGVDITFLVTLPCCCLCLLRKSCYKFQRLVIQSGSNLVKLFLNQHSILSSAISCTRKTQLNKIFFTNSKLLMKLELEHQDIYGEIFIHTIYVTYFSCNYCI